MNRLAALSPALLAVDAAAFAAAWLVVPPGGILTMLLLGVVLLGMNVAGGQYREPWSARRALLLAATAVVAAALVTTLRIVLDVPVATGPAEAAAVFAVGAVLGRTLLHLSARQSPARLHKTSGTRT